ncbi:MAG: glycoside hydrolase family 3 protein [Chloroflexi bacterium]|nr:glycoside hydrolase family 3 protein [Chloroflexota bacterium]
MSRLGPGALVWAAFDGETVPGALLDAIGAGRIGGLALFAFKGNLKTKEQVRAMLREARAATERSGLPPVPVAVDQEGGSVVRVGYRAVFPSAMAIAATGDPADAERVAGAVALGLRADGITVNYAPVCDVNTEPRNPVIGTRSFGDDPERVGLLAASWIRGSETSGVAATAKHFPGHGSSVVDPHHTTVDSHVDRAMLEQRELVPFRSAIAAGVSSVMTAHVRYPALDTERIATLSKPIATDLLRGTLGFRGLAMTDALDMGGVTQVEIPEALAPRAVEAGIDTVMLFDPELQLEAAERIATGVRPQRVLEAVRRASTFRERFGGREADEADDDSARALARDVAARSITLRGTLPDLRGTIRVTAFEPRGLSPVEELGDPISVLERALASRLGDRLRFARDGRVPEGDGPLVVCSSSAFFDPERAAQVRALLATGGVLCALRSPYDATLVPERPALLTYGDVPCSLEALAAVLAGDRAASGRAPVRLA